MRGKIILGLFVLTSMFLFSLQLVSASSVVVYPVSLGYNVSFHVSQISGNYSPISFDGCVNTVSRADWFCDLHNSPMFNLTLRSDNKFLQHERVFKIVSSGVSCQLIFFNDTRIVRDFGSYAYVSGSSLSLGKEVVLVPVYIFVNRTYFINKTVYVPEYHNETIYVNTSWENTSKIEELNATLYNTSKELDNATKGFLFLGYLDICIAILLFLAGIIMWLGNISLEFVKVKK